MGGAGSGNFEERYGRKTTVGECRQLDAAELAREGFFEIGSEGFSYWVDPETREPVVLFGFSTSLGSDGKRVFRVSYRWGDSEDVSLPIRLQTTRLYFGGLRVWFTCPLITDWLVCNQRVKKLYLPPGRRYFGCRKCHDLIYRRRESLQRIDRLKDQLEKHLASAKF